MSESPIPANPRRASEMTFLAVGAIVVAARDLVIGVASYGTRITVPTRTGAP